MTIPASLHMRTLEPDDSRLSYPLVRLTQPDVSFAQWCDILAQSGRAETAAQMLGVFNAGGCLIGLFAATDGEIEAFATSFMIAGHHAALVSLARETLFRARGN